MAKTKPRKYESVSGGESISEHASEWIRLFIKHFELNLLDNSRSLPSDASDLDYRVAAIRAMFETILDSGMDRELFAASVGRILIEKRPGSVAWNSELNQRRFELIDKEIQGTLAPAERVELAGLTDIMREQLDSEANLPMEVQRHCTGNFWAWPSRTNRVDFRLPRPSRRTTPRPIGVCVVRTIPPVASRRVRLSLRLLPEA